MNSSPLVTIGVPVYNGEKFLNECLESISKQTYDNWECLIINNRSSDSSLAIAESFALKEKRFKVYTNEEFVDMPTNFNNTFKYVTDKTKYFKVVCADDWIFPEYVEKMVDLMEQYPNAGICSSFRMDHNDVNCFGLDYRKGPVYDGKEILLRQFLDSDITGSETTVLYRMETLKKIKDYPTIFSYTCYHFDTSLAYELLSISDLCFIFQVLSHTGRSESTYTSKYYDRFRTSLNLREQELTKYLKLFPQLKDEYKKIRIEYGYTILKAHLKRDKESIAWHNKWLNKERKYTTWELFYCLLYVLYSKISHKLRGSN
jgi:glycosyltransferase involved in cell wall biosynthesis